jgi:hypothetical protein
VLVVNKPPFLLVTPSHRMQGTLLLHCCYTVVTLLLHNSHTVVTPSHRMQGPSHLIQPICFCENQNSHACRCRINLDRCKIKEAASSTGSWGTCSGPRGVGGPGKGGRRTSLTDW